MKRFAVALVIAVIGGMALHGQETRSSTLLTTEHYLDWERVREAQISPDGSRVVYTREHVNAIEDKWESETWIVKNDGAEHRFFVKGASARWSPDGKRLLYLADGEPKGSQVFVRWVDVDGPATQVTHVMETPRNVRWSPDGKSIAFSMFEPEQEKWSISMPAEPKGAKWTPPPRIVDTLHYRQDRVGFLEDGYAHLFVVPAEGGTPRALTSGKWSIGAGELRGAAAIDWTPDSKSIVFDGNRDGDADLKYQRSQLYVVDVAGGTIRDLVVKPGSWGEPVVSPDGKLVAFTGYEPSGHTHTTSDLFVVPIAGGAMRKISGDYDRNPNNLVWAPDKIGGSESLADQEAVPGRQAWRFSIVSYMIQGTGADLGNNSVKIRYGITDEASKININALFKLDSSGQTLYNTLMQLPNMTDPIANSIIYWLDPNATPRPLPRRGGGTRRQTDREDRGAVVHVERQHQGPGLDRQAAVVRSGEEVSADP